MPLENVHFEVRYIYEMICGKKHPSYQRYYGSKSNYALAILVDEAGWVRVQKVVDAAKLKLAMAEQY